MPNCSYCGQPAGLFRRYHDECRAGYERATSTIPDFFEKLLDSNLPADRFKDLLREVSGTFHISADNLRLLSIKGINAMVAAALARQLMTLEQEERILDIAGALGFASSDIAELDHKLFKVRVLRDLGEHDIPQRVTVAGPIPVELDDDEVIIWIVNGARTFRSPGSKDLNSANLPQRPPHELPQYFSPASLGLQPVSTDGLVAIGESDLMFTDRHLFIISSDRQWKIRFASVEALHTYSNGFQLFRAKSESKPIVVTLDDPWFAANMIVRLLRLPAKPGNEHDSTDISLPAADLDGLRHDRTPAPARRQRQKRQE